MSEAMETCPACIEKRLHTPEEWRLHPLAGHGKNGGEGWSHLDLLPAKGELKK
jgi:hypothetical protein